MTGSSCQAPCPAPNVCNGHSTWPNACSGRVSNLMTVAVPAGHAQGALCRNAAQRLSKSLSASLALNGSAFSNDLGLSGGSNTLNNLGAQGNALSAVSGLNTNNGARSSGLWRRRVEVGILLEALETKGVVRTLAEPNLVALSGQEAKFLAGGEYPVPISQEGGTITVEFKPFGVELNFVPRVVDGDPDQP